MNMKVDVTYTLQLNARQFNLVGLALAGRLEPEDIQEALELNRTILHGRLKAHEQHVKNTSRAIESLGPDPAQQAVATPPSDSKSAGSPSGIRSPSPGGTAVRRPRIA